MKKRVRKSVGLVVGVLLTAGMFVGCDMLDAIDYIANMDVFYGTTQNSGSVAGGGSSVITRLPTGQHAEVMAYLATHYHEGNDYMYVAYFTVCITGWTREHMYIGGHDELGRTLPIRAYLSERNMGRSVDRGRQRHNPTGWVQNQWELDGSQIWVKNRGHLIAYTFTFNFNDYGYFVYGYGGCEDNPVNLFTQTQHSNQRVMTRFENYIRNALRDGSNVVFKASPVFRGDELMARGIWLQALSDCGDVELSVYVFNRQPGVAFDHATGYNWIY